MIIALVSPSTIFCDDFICSEDPALNDFCLPRLRKFRTYCPNDSLLQLIALTPAENEIVYMDDQFKNVDYSCKVDVAAITVMTMYAERAYAHAAEWRKRGVHVVMGGVHVTMEPEEALQHADTIVTGDADKVWARFLSDLKAGKPKRRYDGGVASIAKSPPPDLDALPREFYWRETFGKEVYSLRTSFGCARRCKFCSNCSLEEGTKFHHKSMRQVEAEIEQMIKKSRGHDFLIGMADDNIFLDKKHAERVFECIKSYGVGWFGGADVSVARHPKFIDLINRSGCSFLCFGLESLDERNLAWNSPWKARQIKDYGRLIRAMRDGGVSVLGSFIVGFDHDSLSVFDEIFDFSMESGLVGTNVAYLLPLPGTPLRKRLTEEDRLESSYGWGAYTGFNFIIKHPKLKKPEIYDLRLKFMQKLESPEVLAKLHGDTLKGAGVSD